MPSYTDQLGRTVFLAEVPQRIVSLVPSQTELLHTLGLGDAVKGITKFCIHPDEWFRHKVRIGGTKDLGL
jgi:ABC-type Fe3+-hydroxamate transport system substrate-binding protein